MESGFKLDADVVSEEVPVDGVVTTLFAVLKGVVGLVLLPHKTLLTEKQNRRMAKSPHFHGNDLPIRFPSQLALSHPKPVHQILKEANYF